MSNNDLDISPTLFKVLRKVTVGLKKEIQKQANLNYSIDQMQALLLVGESPKHQQDIADELQKDKSVVLRIIDKLEKDQMLIRIKDPIDGRRNNLFLTETGRLYTENYRKLENKMLENLFSGLNDAEISQFTRIINHLDNHLSFKD